MRLVQKPDGSNINEGSLAGLRRFGDADKHLPCGPTPWGELVAVNMDTGDIAYRKTLGVTDAFPPQLQKPAVRAPVVPSSPRAALPLSGARMISASARLRPRPVSSSGRPNCRHRSRRRLPRIWARMGGSS